MFYTIVSLITHGVGSGFPLDIEDPGLERSLESVEYGLAEPGPRTGFCFS